MCIRDRVGAITAATLMRKLLFGVQAWDATTLISVGVVLGAASLLASFLPARRDVYKRQALIKPLPYKSPKQLVMLFESIPLGPRFHLSYPDYAHPKLLHRISWPVFFRKAGLLIA